MIKKRGKGWRETLGSKAHVILQLNLFILRGLQGGQWEECRLAPLSKCRGDRGGREGRPSNVWSCCCHSLSSDLTHVANAHATWRRSTHISQTKFEFENLEFWNLKNVFWSWSEGYSVMKVTCPLLCKGEEEKRRGRKDMRGMRHMGMMHFNLDIGTFAEVCISTHTVLFCERKVVNNSESNHKTSCVCAPKHMPRRHSFWEVFLMRSLNGVDKV